MTRLRLFGMGAMLAVAASGAPAQAIPSRMAIFCAELERTIEAVELGDPSGLERSRARPPAFGFSSGCGAQGRGWFCHQSLTPPALSLDSLVAGVSHCRPDLVRARASTADHVLFEGRSVRILIMESGAPRAHVGRIVTFSIEPRSSRQSKVW